MQQDLTEGRIGRQLVKYFLPIAAGTLFQQLYNAVDAVIVGKFVGTIALAAVGGSAANIINFLIGFFVALSGGATVVIAQLYGARAGEELRRATGTAVFFCLLAGGALTAVGLIWAPVFLRWMQAPAETLAWAALYLRIYFSGTIPQLIYNIEAGILRAVGDSRSPFRYLLVGCVSNIVLDLLFVVAFKMGVAGVGLATVISQVISMIPATVKLLRTRENYGISLRTVRPDRPLLRRMMRIGIPSGLQGSMYSVSNMLLQVSINSLGTAVVAGWALSGKLDGFYWAVSGAAGMAIMNFSAQNFGAGRIDRIREGKKVSLRLFIAVTVVFSVLLLTVGIKLLPVFTDDAAVIEATTKIMYYFVPFYFSWTYIEIISGLLRGVGDAVVPVIIQGIGICLFRVVWVVTVFRASPTLFALSMCYPASWILTDAAFLIHYLRGRWIRSAGKQAKAETE